MKKTMPILGLGLMLLILAPAQSIAQVSINVNIGAQPLWGPIGYNSNDC